MKYPLLARLTAGGLLAHALVASAAADILITEFMASNTKTIVDDDGKYSDWIEIANTGAAAVNLSGWHLTDNAGDLTKWTFPSVSIAAYQRMLVWASNEDRRDPAKPLHTNFNLRASGEYLALVRPDGTVEQSFGASFPAQFPDVSYGLGESSPPPVVLIPAGSTANPGPAAKVRVPSLTAPADNADEATWMNSGFDDSTWTTAHTGIGYTTLAPTGDPLTYNSGDLFPPLIAPDGNVQAIYRLKNRGIYIRIPFTVGDTSRFKSLQLKMNHDDGFVAYINGVFKSHALASTPPALPTIPVPYNCTGVPVLGNADTEAAQLKVMPMVSGDSAGVISPGTNVLAIHGINSTATGNDALFNPELSAILYPEPNGTTVYFTAPSPSSGNSTGSTNLGPSVSETTQTVPPLVVQSGATTLESLPVVTSAASGFSGVQGQGGWTWGYHSGTGAYNYLTTFTAMPGGASSGAWNGTTQWWTGTVWDHNTASAAPWTYLTSNTMHPNDASPGPKESPIARWTSTVAGPHTISGNFTRPSTAGDGTTGRVYRNGTQIFSAVTKGDTQAFAIPVTLAVGDRIDFFVDVGPADDDGSDTTNYEAVIREGQVPPVQNVPVLVTTQVAQTLRPISSVVVKYRQMFNAEQSLAMNDAGTGGDVTAGDGIYSATIVTNNLQPGQLIRWRVEATDNQGYITKDPPYQVPAEDQQYFGTIANDPTIASSALPVMHWFMDASVNPDSNTKAPITLYFKGELYDNCQATVHGQSTQGFPKKSNDIDTPSDHRMKVFDDPNARRAKDINILSSYADKSKMRTTLAYETFASAGVKGHYAFPVRIQRNGAFYAIGDFVEDADDRFLDRLGLDPEGALYKVYNSLDGSTITTTNGGGVEKKTRKTEGTADFQAMIDGLVETKTILQRRNYAYDNINVPQLVNMLAVTTMILHNDWGHKNYYMYRDTNGTGEWYLLPWDVDLTFGHTWVGGPAYFDDDIDSSIGAVLGPTNRLKSLVYAGGSGSGASAAPEMAQMFMRRLRTLLDRFVGVSASPAAELETRMRYWADQVDPPTVTTGLSDAWLDFKKWGFWIDASGTQIAYTDSRAGDHFLRPYLNRMIASNPNPPYPSANPNTNLNRTTVPAFLAGRRTTLYATTHQGQAMPAAQVAAPVINIAAVVFNPGVGNQEYIKLTNPGTTAVDVSGWVLSDAIDYRIPDGTVIPAGNGTTDNVGALFIARDPVGFRARSTAPKAAQNCFCVGPYDGQLSARGETLVLSTDTGTQIATNTWAGAPTPAQDSLRVTQILFEPLGPSAAELAGNPALVASDFEWLELTNIGAVSLDLAGAQFTKGIGYTFPAGTTLAAGAKLILAANPAAFALRYPGIAVPVLGPWSGQLDNSGETLQLIDVFGESVLDFSYNDKWYGPADHDGHALVILDAAGTPYNEWGGRPRWGVSLAANGTPAVANPPLGMVYNFWANTPFNTAERDDALISGPDVDIDHDGLSNALEYALNGNPKASSEDRLPVASVVTAGAESYLALTFRRWKNDLDLEYVPEISDGLGFDWTPIGGVIVGAPIDNSDGTETVTIRDTEPANVGRRFMRLRVVIAP